MDRHNIITLPYPNLRKPSVKVSVFGKDLLQTINNMKQAAMDWEDNREHEVTVGLAAIQVDINLKIFIVREDFNDKDNREFMVFINPKITKLSGKIITEHEGCLSVPGFYGMVPRHEECKIEAQDETGQSFTLKTEGFLARIMQHETDHTKGKLYVDHISKNENAFLKLNSDGKMIKAEYKEVVAADLL